VGGDEQRADERGAGALARHEYGLDGLRGVAIAVVLMYHGEVLAAKGGFLGISLFFTLSGFLITSILLRTHARTQSIGLQAFWGRRYRRLLPAAYLTLAGVVLFGATVATRQQLSDLPGAMLAAVLQVTNWFFIFAGQSYVNLFAAPSPVQHFWSLAIEEQFYVVMPIVMIVLLRRVRSLGVIAAVLAVAALASTLWMAALYQYGASLDRLYYGTDTRAAELLVGCALAAFLQWKPLRPATATTRRVWGLAGVLALLAVGWAWSHVVFADTRLWNGGFLAFSLLGAVLIVTVLHHAGPVAWLFAGKPLAAVGRVSYGLYLFHWPIFLWLTESRTHLSVWPLLALRVAVTTAIAIGSYYLLEMPVRNRSLRITPVHLRWAAFATVCVILTGAFVVSGRDAPAQFAGLDTASGLTPAARTDPRLDVLVITDPAGRKLADELRQRAASRDDLGVTVAAPFACTGVVPDGNRETCSNWLQEWPALIKTVKPDVVLFDVTQWDESSLAALSGTTDVTRQAAWARSVLDAGLAHLATGGASIVWAHEVLTLDNIAVMKRPLYEAMDLLTIDTSVLRLRVDGSDVDETVADLRSLRGPSDSNLPRVLVVGDSSSLAFGYGFGRWAGSSGRALVWTVGTGGCGIADDGQLIESGREVAVAERCRVVQKGWKSRVKKFRPDLVIVLSSIYDNQQRRLPGWSKMLVPGDAAFDDYLTNEYAKAYDILSADGAKVLWLQSPCARPSVGPWPTDTRGGPLSTKRVKHVNDVILRRVASMRPELRFFDLFGPLCPSGRFQNDIGGISDFRPDGIHFSPQASNWFGRRYGPAILDAGLV
jgi:peptidoglycan/LPS O-acetylase OafA/YrhL